jgi:hypothetical protein
MPGHTDDASAILSASASSMPAADVLRCKALVDEIVSQMSAAGEAYVGSFGQSLFQIGAELEGLAGRLSVVADAMAVEAGRLLNPPS